MLCKRISHHLGIAADLDLDPLETALDVAADLVRQGPGILVPRIESSRGVGGQRVAIAAQQAVEWGFGRLADDVPKRDIDAADAIISIPRVPRWCARMAMRSTAARPRTDLRQRWPGRARQ